MRSDLTEIYPSCHIPFETFSPIKENDSGDDLKEIVTNLRGAITQFSIAVDALGNPCENECVACVGCKP